MPRFWRGMGPRSLQARLHRSPKTTNLWGRGSTTVHPSRTEIGDFHRRRGQTRRLYQRAVGRLQLAPCRARHLPVEKLSLGPNEHTTPLPPPPPPLVSLLPPPPSPPL